MMSPSSDVKLFTAVFSNLFNEGTLPTVHSIVKTMPAPGLQMCAAAVRYERVTLPFFFTLCCLAMERWRGSVTVERRTCDQ